MSNGSDDKKRKIILDAEVNELSARMIRAVARDELSREQVQELTANDEAWLENARRIAPELMPGDRGQ